MKGILRIAVLLALIFILTAFMAPAVFAVKPENPGGGGGGGGGGVTVAPATYIYADSAGWVKSGTWMLEDYIVDGGKKILVANDAGATATYTTTVKAKFVEVYATTYWLCGNAEVYIDDALVATVNLNSSATTSGVLIYSGKFGGDPTLPHTVAVKALGTGGPGTYTFGGVTYDISYLHFVNVEYFKTW